MLERNYAKPSQVNEIHVLLIKVNIFHLTAIFQ